MFTFQPQTKSTCHWKSFCLAETPQLIVTSEEHSVYFRPLHHIFQPPPSKPRQSQSVSIPIDWLWALFLLLTALCGSFHKQMCGGESSNVTYTSASLGSLVTNLHHTFDVWKCICDIPNHFSVSSTPFMSSHVSEIYQTTWIVAISLQ